MSITKRIAKRGDLSFWLTFADGYTTLSFRDGGERDYRRTAFYLTPLQAKKLADEILLWLEEQR